MLASAEERTAIDQAIQSRVFAPGGLGWIMVDGDNREEEQLEAVADSAIDALASVLNRIIADPQIKVTAIEVARPHERAIVLCYFLRADGIDWHTMEIKDVVHYIDLRVESLAEPTLLSPAATAESQELRRKPGRPSSQNEVLTLFKSRYPGASQLPKGRAKEVATELIVELQVPEKVRTVAGWITRYLRNA
nr:hypothetical protein [uncultured Rhodopila sp.]